MKPIKDTINEMKKNNSFVQRLESIKSEVMTHPDIVQFIREHQSEVSEDVIDRSMGRLYEYINQSQECNKCESLEQCKNMLQGYHPHLVLRGRTIDLQYDRCPRKEMYDTRKKNQALIQSLYMPRDILSASMGNLELDHSSRLQAVQFADQFIEALKNGEKKKGLYLYGPFGVGKSYILGAIANQLAENKIGSMMVYYPEFIRELKGSFQDNSFNNKVETVKKVPVLMIDDIGAESMSSWMRDDILGAILQFRMLENLPTFFTSNFDLKQLEHHLSYTQRGEEEKVKAARIMERIKYLTTPVELQGKNRRI